MLQFKNLKEWSYPLQQQDQIGERKSGSSNVGKVNTALNLMRTIRNRAFHWEKLLKTRTINGVVFSRITHSELEVMPDKILVFLYDLINTIDNEAIRKYQKKGQSKKVGVNARKLYHQDLLIFAIL